VKSVVKIWWWALAIKLVLAALIPLSEDEAYYWVWSKHLQWSYFDHPGMVAWLFWLGHFFEPLGQAVRWPSVIMGHLTLLIWIFILKKWLPGEDLQNKSRYWLWLALSSPMIGFGSLLATPDVPVIFFWSLATFFVGEILARQRPRDYLFLGVSLGLGFCSKYHIVLFILSLVLWLLLERRWKEISLRGLMLTVLAGAVCSFPVIWWNYKNGFQSFRYQLDHGFGDTHWEFFWTYSYLLGQVLLLGPITLWMAAKAKPGSGFRFLIYTAWCPLGFFVLSSFRGTAEVNWPIVAYPAVYALAVFASTQLKYLWWTILPWAALAIAVLAQTFFPYTNQFPDRISETHHFDQILPLVKTYSPIYYGNYQMASRVWYEYKTPTKKLYQINRHDLFDEMQQGPAEESHFYVAKESWVSWPAWMTEEKYQISKVLEIPPKFTFYEVTKK